MKIEIIKNPKELGQAAGAAGAQHIRKSITEKGFANIILATGTSQFETLNQLLTEPGIDWGKVTMFHLDEYIGLPVSHPASFRKYLKERFISKVPPMKGVYLINGEGDMDKACAGLAESIKKSPIDVAFIGIGENGHLAFNDPPADFETEAPYIVVTLDEACRKQQMGEGWFKSMDEVPRKAISMSVKQILKSKAIICSVPDLRKAEAVKNCAEHSISNLFPSTALQGHGDCVVFLDEESSSLLAK